MLGPGPSLEETVLLARQDPLALEILNAVFLEL